MMRKCKRYELSCTKCIKVKGGRQPGKVGGTYGCDSSKPGCASSGLATSGRPFAFLASTLSCSAPTRGARALASAAAAAPAAGDRSAALPPAAPRQVPANRRCALAGSQPSQGPEAEGGAAEEGEEEGDGNAPFGEHNGDDAAEETAASPPSSQNADPSQAQPPWAAGWGLATGEEEPEGREGAERGIKMALRARE